MWEITLAELAGRPIMGQMIKILGARVRESISKAIEITQGECHAETRIYWCPIVLGIRVISKTPANLKIIGVRYVVFHEGASVQSGSWEHTSSVASSGLTTSVIQIGSKENKELKIAINPTLLPSGWPQNNSHWRVNGVIDIDCGYGIISKQFVLEEITIENSQIWNECKQEFERRFKQYLQP